MTDFTKLFADALGKRGDIEQARINDFMKALGVDPKAVGDAAIPDSKKIELQKQMIATLSARVVSLEDDNAKLKTSLGKTVAMVKKLLARTGALEKQAGITPPPEHLA